MKAKQATVIELAVDEATRRFHERVVQAYKEIGSFSRAAQLLRMSEEDIKAIVEQHG